MLGNGQAKGWGGKDTWRAGGGVQDGLQHNDGQQVAAPTLGPVQMASLHLRLLHLMKQHRSSWFGPRSDLQNVGGERGSDGS